MSESDSESQYNEDEENSSTAEPPKHDQEENLDDLMKPVKKVKHGKGTFRGMGLNEPTLKGIAKLGFKQPTPIQRKVIPIILTGKDCVGMARTGSGKTAAFLIPIIHLLTSATTTSPSSGCRGLILSPTRELTQQTFRVGKMLCAGGSNLRLCLLQGGDSLEEQFEMLAKKPDIVVATPGRLAHLLMEVGNDFSLSRVEVLVFDEADRLFEMGFAAQLQEIMNKTPESRQTLMFSATLPKKLADFTRAGLKTPELIRLDTDVRVSESLSFAFFKIRFEEKPAALVYLITNNIVNTKTDSNIVFCGTKQEVEFVCRLLRKVLKTTDNSSRKQQRHQGNKEGRGVTYNNKRKQPQEGEEMLDMVEEDHCGVGMVHGSMDHQARQDALEKFRNGEYKVLVVTDLAARGLDIPHINNVINYEFPDKAKLFVHRVGRAARMGRIGAAFSLATSDELAHVVDVYEYLGKKVFEENSFVKESSFGAFPNFVLDQEVEMVNNLLGEDEELNVLFHSSLNGNKKRVSLREPPSKPGIKKAKEMLKNVNLIPIHPMLKQEEKTPTPESNPSTKAITMTSLSAYRPMRSVFEVETSKNGGKINKKTLDFVRHVRRAEADAKQQSGEQEEEEEEEALEELDEAKPNKARLSKAERKRLKKNKHAELPRKKEEKSFKSEHYISYEPTKSEDKHKTYENHLEMNNLPTRIEEEIFDLVPDDGNALMNHSRSVKWDKRKKQFIQATARDHILSGRMKNEAGAFISNKKVTHGVQYEKWQKRNGETKEPDGFERKRKRASSKDGNDKRWKEELKSPEEVIKTNLEKKRKVMRQKSPRKRTKPGEDARINRIGKAPPKVGRYTRSRRG